MTCENTLTTQSRQNAVEDNIFTTELQNDLIELQNQVYALAPIIIAISAVILMELRE